MKIIDVKNQGMARIGHTNTTPKKAKYSYANVNVDPRETVAGYSGCCQARENLRFIQCIIFTYLLWDKEGQLSKAGVSSIREMSWGAISK